MERMERMANMTNMSRTKEMTQELLCIILNEMIDVEKYAIRCNVVDCVCTHSITFMNPNEIDVRKVFYMNEDRKRYYVEMGLKNGVSIVAPLEKRHFKDERIRKIRKPLTK